MTCPPNYFSSRLIEIRSKSNPSVTGSSNTNVPLYPSLEKRGKGRFSQHNFKIPLYPPLLAAQALAQRAKGG